MKRNIVMVVGDSGSGKNHLANILIDNGYKKILTTTTRAPRANEVDGKDYNFVDNKTAGLIDYVESVLIDGHIYGLDVEELMGMVKTNNDLVLIIEPYGLGNVLHYLADNGIVTKDSNDIIRIIYMDKPEHKRFKNIVNGLMDNMVFDSKQDRKRTKYQFIRSAIKRLDRTDTIKDSVLHRDLTIFESLFKGGDIHNNIDYPTLRKKMDIPDVIWCNNRYHLDTLMNTGLISHCKGER